MSKIASYIEQSYLRIYEFNDLASNLTNVGEDLIDNQLSFIFEEFSETVTAFEERDEIELLDGAVDCFVTVVGLLQKLEAAGFDVAEAMKRVDLNNLSKMPKSTESVQYDSAFTKTYNERYDRYVIKDGNKKVRKPSGFVQVSLIDLCPDTLFK